MRIARCLVVALLAAACAGSPPPEEAGTAQQGRGLGGAPGRRLPPQLPDTTGWGVHVLVLGTDREGNIWAGTFGQGLYVMRTDARNWEQILPREGDSTSLSWGFINSLAFPDDGSIWYGTVGNGWGRSTDGGQTWRNWTFDELGPEWQYVAHHGIKALGDSVLIATADGLRITPDGGNTWHCVVAAQTVAGGSTRRGAVPCNTTAQTLPTEYLLSLEVGLDGSIWVGHLKGVTWSRDGGRTWRNLGTAEGIPNARIRAIAMAADSMVWVASEDEIVVDSSRQRKFVPATIKLPGWGGLPGKPRAIVPTPMVAEPSLVLSFGLAAGNGMGDFRVYFAAAGDEYKPAADMWSMIWTGPPLWPVGGSAAGLSRILAGEGPQIEYIRVQQAGPPEDLRHPVFERPIADDEGNPYIDGTYRYGSTMGGNFQQHQGVEFNNPAGTPVHAIADGTVVYAGPAEQGALTVAIRHDVRYQDRYVFSAYYHNSSIETRVGDRVRAGDVIARVGNTGRATNDHLHLEVHLAPTPDSSAIVNPDERYPPYTVNPELWIRPLPGTGTIVGRVLDANGQPIPGARVRGVVWPYPAETPFSFAETYRDRAHADPAYNENFAVSDVPAGRYLLGVDIDGERKWRRVTVEAGRVTFVEFR